jgi:hypothetical protein
MRSLVEECALCVAGYERLLKSSAVGPISKVRGAFGGIRGSRSPRFLSGWFRFQVPRASAPKRLMLRL